MKSTEFVKYLVQIAKEENIPMNVTKLMKCMYICDGFLLAVGKNYIEENARTWEFGPVYPKAYKAVTKSQDLSTVGAPSEETVNFIKENHIDNLVKLILHKFGIMKAVDLSKWSHEEGSPWSITMNMNQGKLNCVINKTLIASYFSYLINNAEGKNGN